MEVNHFLLLFTDSSVQISIALVVMYLGVLVGSAEWLSRQIQIDAEYTRKIVHIGSGNVVLFAWLLDIPMEIGVAAAIVAGLIALLSYFLPILPSVNSVGRRSLGTFFYAVSIGILIWWFWSLHCPYFAALGILIMAWGDGLAAVIGKNFGRHPYHILGSQKSLEGTSTMLLISFLIGIIILPNANILPWQQFGLAMIVAGLATFLESFSQLGIDNLTVPVGSAAIAFLATQYVF